MRWINILLALILFMSSVHVGPTVSFAETDDPAYWAWPENTVVSSDINVINCGLQFVKMQNNNQEMVLEIGYKSVVSPPRLHWVDIRFQPDLAAKIEGISAKVGLTRTRQFTKTSELSDTPYTAPDNANIWRVALDKPGAGIFTSTPITTSNYTQEIVVKLNAPLTEAEMAKRYAAELRLVGKEGDQYSISRRTINNTIYIEPQSPSEGRGNWLYAASMYPAYESEAKYKQSPQGGTATDVQQSEGQGLLVFRNKYFVDTVYNLAIGVRKQYQYVVKLDPKILPAILGDYVYVQSHLVGGKFNRGTAIHKSAFTAANGYTVIVSKAKGNATDTRDYMQPETSQVWVMITDVRIPVDESKLYGPGESMAKFYAQTWFIGADDTTFVKNSRTSGQLLIEKTALPEVTNIDKINADKTADELKTDEANKNVARVTQKMLRGTTEPATLKEVPDPNNDNNTIVVKKQTKFHIKKDGAAVGPGEEIDGTTVVGTYQAEEDGSFLVEFGQSFQEMGYAVDDTLTITAIANGKTLSDPLSVTLIEEKTHTPSNANPDYKIQSNWLQIRGTVDRHQFKTPFTAELTWKKNADGSEVKATVESTDVTVKPDGTLTINIPESIQAHMVKDDTITVVLTEETYAPSDPWTLTVIDNPADESASPKINGPIQNTDTVITGTGVPGATVKLTVPGVENPITLTVGQDGTWTTDPNTPLDLKGQVDRVVTATQKEADKPRESGPVTRTIFQDEEQPKEILVRYFLETKDGEYTQYVQNTDGTYREGTGNTTRYTKYKNNELSKDSTVYTDETAGSSLALVNPPENYVLNEEKTTLPKTMDFTKAASEQVIDVYYSADRNSTYVIRVDVYFGEGDDLNQYAKNDGESYERTIPKVFSYEVQEEDVQTKVVTVNGVNYLYKQADPEAVDSKFSFTVADDGNIQKLYFEKEVVVTEVTPVDPSQPFNPDNQDDENNSQTTPQGAHRVIFDANGGTFGTYAAPNDTVDVAKKAYDVKDGVKMTEVPTPTKEGFTFKGYKLQGDADANQVYSVAEIQEMTITADKTFVAEWEAIPDQTEVTPKDPSQPFNPEDQEDTNNSQKTPNGAHRVIFDGNGGTFGKYAAPNDTVDVAKKAYDVKDGVKMADVPTPTKEGFTFKGYKLQGDADANKVYSVAEIQEMTITADKTFVAEWEAIQQTEKPTDVKVVKDPTDGKFYVEGKAPAGSTVEVKKPDGASYEPPKTVTAGEDGSFKVELPEDYNDKDTVKVTAKEDGKAESDPAEATVDKTAPSAPTVADPKTGDTSITVTLPEDAKAGDTVIVKVGDKEYTHTVTEEDLNKDPKEVTVPVDSALEKDQTVTVTIKDEAGNESASVNKTVTDPTPAEKTASPSEVSATNDPAKETTTVEGNAPAGSTVIVKDKDGKEIGRGTADENGKFTVEVSPKQTAGNDVTVIAQEEGKEPSDHVTATVGEKQVVDGVLRLVNSRCDEQQPITSFVQLNKDFIDANLSQNEYQLLAVQGGADASTSAVIALQVTKNARYAWEIKIPDFKSENCQYQIHIDGFLRKVEAGTVGLSEAQILNAVRMSQAQQDIYVEKQVDAMSLAALNSAIESMKAERGARGASYFVEVEVTLPSENTEANRSAEEEVESEAAPAMSEQLLAKPLQNDSFEALEGQLEDALRTYLGLDQSSLVEMLEDGDGSYLITLPDGSKLLAQLTELPPPAESPEPSVESPETETAPTILDESGVGEEAQTEGASDLEGEVPEISESLLEDQAGDEEKNEPSLSEPNEGAALSEEEELNAEAELQDQPSAPASARYTVSLSLYQDVMAAEEAMPLIDVEEPVTEQKLKVQVPVFLYIEAEEMVPPTPEPEVTESETELETSPTVILDLTGHYQNQSGAQVTVNPKPDSTPAQVTGQAVHRPLPATGERSFIELAVMLLLMATALIFVRRRQI